MIGMRLLMSGLFLCALATPDASAAQYDIVIKNGRIVDGSGAPWYRGDVGVRDGKIAKIGRIPESDGRRVIDAQGLVVAPGFIDMMGQTATPMIEDSKAALNLLTQGITTINAGEGVSAAPLSDEDAARLGWRTLDEYFTLVELKGMPVNAVQTIGHTQIRRLVLGEVDRRPNEEELKRMQAYVREAMEAGAIGVSTALIYPPAVYAQTEEIAALVETAGEYGGRYYTHMRNEGDLLLEAIDEALEIGRAGNAPVHIFHLKAAGRQNWGKMQLAIARIKAARAEGRQVTADIYPYINNGLGAAAFIHPRHFSEGREKLLRRLDDKELRAEIRKEMETTGGWENWYRHCGNDWNKVIIGQSSDEKYSPHVGQSVAAIAKAVDENPWDTFFGLVKSGAFALPESMTDANKILAMQQEFVSFCTDVGPAGGSRISSHPRAFGAFPRLLAHYVRDLGAISLERAIAQASAVAANDVLAYDRGRIVEGLAADIIVFDYEKLTDKATFSQPNELAEGMKHVIVNGELVLKNGELTDNRPGRILRGPGYRAETAPFQVSQGPEIGMPEFDQAMRDYMEKHRIPGGSLAVTYKGRLVHARGYGYADIATHEKVTPTSLFRIASISKPITAVGILQLIEQEKLSLDDKIYDLLKFEQYAKETPEFDERLKEITIRHLLEHRGGWDRGESFDAMFRAVQFAEQLGTPPPAGPAEIIRVMFGQKLDFSPGERYAYSNYGYCLLGRVIEELTGQSYEEYTKQHVLAPAGIHDITIGRPRLAGRFPHEVCYYHPGQGTSVYAEDVGQTVPWPYGAWNHEAMDSHGAWIASAVDLAKFAVALDRPEQSKLITPESIELMHVRPPGLAGYNDDETPKNSYYSLGWSNREGSDGQFHHSHSGSLPGTATILVRRADGVNFSALFNSRMSPYASHFGRGVEAVLHDTVNSISEWPDHDLFEEFQDQ